LIATRILFDGGLAVKTERKGRRVKEEGERKKAGGRR
jgi:hypothetical protein